MSALKDSYSSLRNLFKHDLTVNHISEEITSCEIYDSVEDARITMLEKGFDGLGVKENGVIVGYIKKKDLREESSIMELTRTFKMKEIVSETTSLLDTLFLLRDTERLFVLEGNRIKKLVTRADIQKTPVRLLLFGLVSLLEMNLVKIIRAYLPFDSWKKYLTESRLKIAEDIFNARKKKNQEIDLCDCLQFCDKREILLKDNELFGLFGFESKKRGREDLKAIEDLRDHLAHAQDLLSSFEFNELISLVEKSKVFLDKCENLLNKIPYEMEYPI